MAVLVVTSTAVFQQAPPSEPAQLEASLPLAQALPELQLGQTGGDAVRAGLEHEFWRARIKERCESRGYSVTEEYHLGDGKRVDLLARHQNRNILIEIETGKSDVQANIAKCAGHGELVVFFTSVAATRNNTLPTVRNFQRDFKQLGKRVGITGIRMSPHTCRHSFACEYLRRGGNLEFLRRILGHSSILTTQKYLRSLGVEDLQAVHNGLSMLSR